MASSRTKIRFSGRVIEVIKETLWKRCLFTPTKPPAKNSNICLSETAYRHKGTRKKCKKTNQAATIRWQRQCLITSNVQTTYKWLSRWQGCQLVFGRIFIIDIFHDKEMLCPAFLWVVPRNFTVLEKEMKEFDSILARYTAIFN